MIFALVSLPLAALALVYFINHRYSGTPLWNVRGEPGVHELVWVLNFISFFFLYPSTFNILEVRLCIQAPGGILHLLSCHVIGLSLAIAHRLSSFCCPKAASGSCPGFCSVRPACQH